MPGAQLPATAETDSIFSRHGNVAAELKRIDTATLQQAGDPLPHKTKKTCGSMQQGKENPVSLYYQRDFILKPSNLQ